MDSKDKIEILRCYVIKCEKILGIRKSANFTAHGVPGLMCTECFIKELQDD